MSEAKPFASLSPSLLARKGAAKPAMRPQLQPIHQFHEATARQLEEDLGWNDHGDDFFEEIPPVEILQLDAADHVTGQVLPINGGELSASVTVNGEVPEVVRQQRSVARSVAKPAAPRGAALAQSRRVAFTLRLDAERHLKLRLASTVVNRSAQQIVTEALDRLIDEMPEIEALASQLDKRG